jgi:pyruvate kinase
MTADLTKLAEAMDKLIEDVSGGKATPKPRLGVRSSSRPDLGTAPPISCRRDLRALQRNLMLLGLSSMGRLESRVMPTLLAVKSALAALLNRPPAPGPSAEEFLAGERKLAAETRAILGKSAAAAPVALLVTCPTEAANDPTFMLELAKRGVQGVRINCAHDDADAWGRMIGHLRAAEAATDRDLKVFMDLAGPKIRNGDIRMPDHGKKTHRGDLIAILTEPS